MERFIKEYAGYKKAQILQYELMTEEKKTEALKHIDGVLKARERGLITADEAIKSILYFFE